MKVSIITVTWNSEEFIETCIQSVLSQTYSNIEYIIVDGGSTDKTLSIIEKYKDCIAYIISEKDNGIYDAMNKGIAIATGDIIGILNSDDFFNSSTTLQDITRHFTESKADIVYGDLWYVDRLNPKKLVRKWKSGYYKPGHFQWGWMPPHPTFYAKRKLFELHGNYNPEFGSAADYELMLRFLHFHKCTVAYLPEVIVKMRTGGISNHSFKNRLKATKADFKAMCKNKVTFPALAAILKPLRKIPQFFDR